MGEDRVVLENIVKNYRYFTLRVDYAEFKKGLNLVIGSNYDSKDYSWIYMA